MEQVQEWWWSLPAESMAAIMMSPLYATVFLLWVIKVWRKVMSTPNESAILERFDKLQEAPPWWSPVAQAIVDRVNAGTEGVYANPNGGYWLVLTGGWRIQVMDWHSNPIVLRSPDDKDICPVLDDSERNRLVAFLDDQHRQAIVRAVKPPEPEPTPAPSEDSQPFADNDPVTDLVDRVNVLISKVNGTLAVMEQIIKDATPGGDATGGSPGRREYVVKLSSQVLTELGATLTRVSLLASKVDNLTAVVTQLVKEFRTPATVWTLNPGADAVNACKKAAENIARGADPGPGREPMWHGLTGEQWVELCDEFRQAIKEKRVEQSGGGDRSVGVILPVKTSDPKPDIGRVLGCYRNRPGHVGGTYDGGWIYWYSESKQKVLADSGLLTQSAAAPDATS